MNHYAEDDRISVEMGNKIISQCEKLGLDFAGTCAGGHPITEDAWVFHAHLDLGFRKQTRMFDFEIEEKLTELLSRIGLRLYTCSFGKYDDRWFIELTATQRRKKRVVNGRFISSQVYKKKEEKLKNE